MKVKVKVDVDVSLLRSTKKKEGLCLQRRSATRKFVETCLSRGGKKIRDAIASARVVVVPSSWLRLVLLLVGEVVDNQIKE